MKPLTCAHANKCSFAFWTSFFLHVTHSSGKHLRWEQSIPVPWHLVCSLYLLSLVLLDCFICPFQCSSELWNSSELGDVLQKQSECQSCHFWQHVRNVCFFLPCSRRLSLQLSTESGKASFGKCWSSQACVLLVSGFAVGMLCTHSPVSSTQPLSSLQKHQSLPRRVIHFIKPVTF